MYCEKCGTKIEDNASFCPNCGNKLVFNIKVDKPKQSDKTAVVKNSKTKRNIIIIILCIILFIIFVFAGFILNHRNSTSSNDSVNGAVASNNEYYLQKQVSYIPNDFEDLSKGVKIDTTSYYNENGLIIKEESENAVKEYSYDKDNRITSFDIIDNNTGEVYTFNFTYQKSEGVFIGVSNTISENVSYNLDGKNFDYGENLIYWEYRYDNQNRLIYKASYYNDNLLTYEQTEYYDNGINKKMKSYLGHIGLDNEVSGSLSETEYDENGNPIMINEYDDNGTIYYKYEAEYKNNKLYKTTTHDYDGISSISVLNKEYDNKYECINYDKNNEITGYTVTECDSNGNILKIEYFDKNFEPLHNYNLYEYDENGNNILTQQYHNGMLNYKTEKTFAKK